MKDPYYHIKKLALGINWGKPRSEFYRPACCIFLSLCPLAESRRMFLPTSGNGMGSLHKLERAAARPHGPLGKLDKGTPAPKAAQLCARTHGLTSRARMDFSPACPLLEQLPLCSIRSAQPQAAALPSGLLSSSSGGACELFAPPDMHVNFNCITKKFSRKKIWRMHYEYVPDLPAFSANAGPCK